MPVCRLDVIVCMNNLINAVMQNIFMVLKNKFYPPDVCAGNGTYVCKIGQELLMS